MQLKEVVLESGQGMDSSRKLVAVWKDCGSPGGRILPQPIQAWEGCTFQKVGHGTLVPGQQRRGKEGVFTSGQKWVGYRGRFLETRCACWVFHCKTFAFFSRASIPAIPEDPLPARSTQGESLRLWPKVESWNLSSGSSMTACS